MAFASPDFDLAFGRWPAIGGGVREALARLGSLRPLLSQAVARLVARFIATPSVAEREVAQVPRAVREASISLRPMTLAEQWSKLSIVLVRSVDSARVATEMQSAATQQLDLAQYGLITLVDELSAVMALPGRRSRTATVHAFGGTLDASDAKFHALAA